MNGIERAAGAAILGVAVLVGVACSRVTPPPPTSAVSPSVDATLLGTFDHVVVVVLENENAQTVLAVPAMDTLAQQGVLLANYYAVAHPSYPNYLALVSGHTFMGGDSQARHDPDAYRALDLGDAQLEIDAPTIIDGFDAKGLSWDVFAEDYPDTSRAPTHCDFRRQSGLYARKHVPFLSFTEFRAHPAWCQHVRNLRWLSRDSLAAYTFIAPNLKHDGHDAPLDTAVTWLRAFLSPILADSATMKRTLVVITFDEAANPLTEVLFGNQPNRIYTVLQGGMLLRGHRSDRQYSHLSLLRTVEDNFGLPHLEPATVVPITDVWQTATPGK
ncbi:MAG: alkaline phosphatase family protein [Gemmatimonadaceae bacterium]